MKRLNSLSVSIKINPNDLDKIQRYIGSHKFQLEEIYWLKIKDKNSSFFKIKFQDIPFEEFIRLCTKFKKHAKIEEMGIEFKSRRNCLLLLQDVGFAKYEEINYVDFRYEKKNVIIAVMKEDGFYKLKLQIIDSNKETNELFLQKLINRVFEIIGQRSG